jgi:hypothetical protein
MKVLSLIGNVPFATHQKIKIIAMFYCKTWYNFNNFYAIENLLVPKEAENKGLYGN